MFRRPIKKIPILLSSLAAGILIHGIAADQTAKKTPTPIHRWTRGASLQTARSASCAVALADGRMIVPGGSGESGPLASVEQSLPGGDFVDVQPMREARADHSCALLQDGLLLVAGGTTNGGGATNSAELFSADDNQWTAAGSMSTGRAGATATTLKDGRVLIAGGRTATGVSNTLEVFDPKTQRFTTLSAMLTSPRADHAAAASGTAVCSSRAARTARGPWIASMCSIPSRAR